MRYNISENKSKLTAAEPGVFLASTFLVGCALGFSVDGALESGAGSDSPFGGSLFSGMGATVGLTGVRVDILPGAVLGLGGSFFTGLSGSGRGSFGILLAPDVTEPA